MRLASCSSSCLLFGLFGLLACREAPASEPPGEIRVEPPATREPAPLEPGVLELSTAACAIAPDARVWCRNAEILGDEPGWLPGASAVDRLWLVDQTPCTASEGRVRCVYPEDPLAAPLPGDAEGFAIVPSGAALIDVAWYDRQQCLVDERGTAWCRWLSWDDDAPQPPLEPYPLAEVRDVELGDEIGCMRLADGSAHCLFGAGMLAISELDARLSATVGELCAALPDSPHCDAPIGERRDWPAPFRVLDRSRDLAVGGNFACLIDDHGTVACVTTIAMSGRPTIGGTQDFEAIPGLPAMVEIDASDDHVCGRSEAGEVWCWGSNEYGQLGDGTTTSHARSTPVKAGAWPDLRQISVGFGKSCVVRAESIECWGWLSERHTDRTPTEIPGVRASELASRESTTCAHEGPSWKCWGGDTWTLAGASGAARIVEVAEWIDKPSPECRLDGRRLTCVDDQGATTLDLRDVVAAIPAYPEICALLDRRVVCLSPAFEALGRTEFAVPASTAISGLEWHGCVLDVRGKPHCWDEDHRVEAIAIDTKLVDLVATLDGDCGLDRAGKVHCWGREGEPPFVLELAKIAELAGTSRGACARGVEGSVWCWGSDLAPGEFVSPRAAIEIEVPSATQIVAGTSHFCSIAGEGRVHCWGSETDSQRARIDPDFALRPEPIDFFAP
ncbi:RCC1 domain-containing protein [Nannocystaceae bacterium ST9]